MRRHSMQPIEINGLTLVFLITILICMNPHLLVKSVWLS
uniref:Uncharacterized protein n=1 Tax=Anguilla anguilla TaxID=7936 RepID=A0A0E9RMR3_ANGAN